METQIENSTNPKRVQLDHLLLDVDFFHKPTVKEFRLEFGYAAACWLIELYCLMSRATDGCISRRLAVGTADDMRLENGNAMIDYCLANGLLQLEDDQLTNSRVIKDQEQCAKKRARWRKAKSRDEESSEDSARNVARNKRDSVNTEDLNTEDLNIDLENSQPVPQPEIPPDDPELKFANDQLEDPNTPKVRNSSVFMATGQRPIRKYPALWLTPHELRDVFRIAQESGLPRNKLEILFKPINGWAMKQVAKGRPPDSLNAFGALTGWGLQDALKTLKQAKDLERSEFYLNNAKA